MWCGLWNKSNLPEWFAKQKYENWTKAFVSSLVLNMNSFLWDKAAMRWGYIMFWICNVTLQFTFKWFIVMYCIYVKVKYVCFVWDGDYSVMPSFCIYY